jgi:hypothetical protein
MVKTKDNKLIKYIGREYYMQCMVPNGPADRCRGSYYLLGRRIGAMDPATQWYSGQVPWILLSNGLAYRCH